MSEPAFPIPDRRYPSGQNGMSLRDYFAAAALTGIKSNPELLRICSNAAAENGGKQQDFVAKMAYVDADSMLKARNLNI